MKILLTGGSGMVGRNILDYARTHGAAYQIYAPTSNELNLLDRASTEAYMLQHRPDLVIHCAGRVGGIQANISNPVSFLIDNLDMARNILGAAHKARVTKVLNMGTSCMYPRDAENPLKEELVLKGELEPTNEGYAIAKVFAAKYASYIHRENNDLKYKTLIPCNLYGRHDNYDPLSSHMIPAVIHKIHVAMKAGDSTVEIWGDGTARREFMDAYDLADFVFFALKNFDQVPELINVGLGFDYSINEYYRTVAKVLGYKGSFTHNLNKPVGMKRKLVSVERSAALGWKAKTSLEEGISRAYDYYLNLHKEIKGEHNV
jgi:GDP-L-fucose synthase